MAHWELPAPHEDGVVQDELSNINGYRLLDPIASGARIGENPNASAAKKITRNNSIAPH